MSDTNGLRVAPAALTEHTFDSGITVQIGKVSRRLVDDLDAAFPPPEPPTRRVSAELSLDGVERDEPNPNDPAHQRALDAHARAHAERVNRLFIKRGVVVTIDHELLAQLRADLEGAGISRDNQEPDDHYLYVTRIVLATDEDREEFHRLLTRRNLPTADAVRREL